MSDIEIFAVVIFAAAFAGVAFFRYAEYRNLRSRRWMALSRIGYGRPKIMVQAILLGCFVCLGVAQIFLGSVVFGILWIVAGAMQCWEQMCRYDKHYRVILTPYRIIFSSGASSWRYGNVRNVVYSAAKREVEIFSHGNLRTPVPMDESDFATMRETLKRYAPDVVVEER